MPLEEVLANILESISVEWMDASDSGTPYETREDNYQEPVLDTYDLLYDEESIGAKHKKLFDDIIHTIYDSL